MIGWIVFGVIAYLATGYVVTWFLMVRDPKADLPTAQAGELVAMNFLWPLAAAFFILFSPVFFFMWLDEINFWQKFYGVRR